MAANYQDIDMGFDALFDALGDFNGARVETGLFDHENAMKGIYAEYETRTSHARPWLSVAADTVAPSVERVVSFDLRKFGPMSMAENVMGDIAKVTKPHTRDVIVGQKMGGPPLKKETVDRKGHSLKLIDSGEMLAAIDAEVKMRGDQ